jgi:hypothetical protein
MYFFSEDMPKTSFLLVFRTPTLAGRPTRPPPGHLFGPTWPGVCPSPLRELHGGDTDTTPTPEVTGAAAGNCTAAAADGGERAKAICSAPPFILSPNTAHVIATAVTTLSPAPLLPTLHPTERLPSLSHQIKGILCQPPSVKIRARQYFLVEKKVVMNDE